MLNKRKILLGVTGGIAAYKTPELVRLLRKAGAEVQVICTPSALQFVTLYTLTVVSERPALVDFFDEESGNWNHHVEMGLWADAMVIAPCGSNTLGKMAQGLCDNLLLTTFLSARCPVWVAPAMDLDMYKQSAVRENLTLLESRDVRVIDAEEGPLASGLEGKGRMAEPENIVTVLSEYFNPPYSQWNNKKVLVTAGPTYEHIDPVRFIGNHSTGAMGIEIAERLEELGASVHLVLGPTHLSPNDRIEVSKVTTAEEMLKFVNDIFPIMTEEFSLQPLPIINQRILLDQKIKKTEEALHIDLIPNKDILKELSLCQTRQSIHSRICVRNRGCRRQCSEKIIQ
jgi:phosphopantothenoylcysteine decarboxylase/phosphopantothenate--cysteine ligase